MLVRGEIIAFLKPWAKFMLKAEARCDCRGFKVMAHLSGSVL